MDRVLHAQTRMPAIRALELVGFELHSTCTRWDCRVNEAAGVNVGEANMALIGPSFSHVCLVLLQVKRSNTARIQGIAFPKDLPAGGLKLGLKLEATNLNLAATLVENLGDPRVQVFPSAPRPRAPA